MTSLKPKSKTKYLYSKTAKPYKKRKHTGTIIAKTVNTRKGPGISYGLKQVLHKGDKVLVCDAILSKSGNPWYYIYANKKYCYVAGARVSIVTAKAPAKKHAAKKPAKAPAKKPVVKKPAPVKMNANAKKFLSELAAYNEFIKSHPSKFYYHYDGELTSFSKAKSRVLKGTRVGITCVVPIRWALKAVDVKRADGKSLIHAVDGTFKNSFNGPAKNKLSRITSGAAIGKTIKQAVDKKLLKPGDILCFKGHTHTFAYTGNKYYMYEGGHANIVHGKYTGMMPDYSKKYKGCKIGEILRWK